MQSSCKCACQLFEFESVPVFFSGSLTGTYRCAVCDGMQQIITARVRVKDETSNATMQGGGAHSVWKDAQGTWKLRLLVPNNVRRSRAHHAPQVQFSLRLFCLRRAVLMLCGILSMRVRSCAT